MFVSSRIFVVAVGVVTIGYNWGGVGDSPADDVFERGIAKGRRTPF